MARLKPGRRSGGDNRVWRGGPPTLGRWKPKRRRLQGLLFSASVWLDVREGRTPSSWVHSVYLMVYRDEGKLYLPGPGGPTEIRDGDYVVKLGDSYLRLPVTQFDELMEDSS